MAKSPRSDAQRAASRANGCKSAGPRTLAGKNRSRRNAIKHGLRAASLDILPSDVEAPPLSLAPLTLANAVRERLAPADVIEAELVEGIALAYWRLRRARQLEEALIEGRPDAVAPSTLSRFLLRRSNAIDALGLLLRYRNQALCELARLGRLLEQHRRPPAPSTDFSEQAKPPTPPPSAVSAARRSSRSGRRQAANDNGRGGASSKPTDMAAPSATEVDKAGSLPHRGLDQGQRATDPAPPGPGGTLS